MFGCMLLIHRDNQMKPCGHVGESEVSGRWIIMLIYIGDKSWIVTYHFLHGLLDYIHSTFSWVILGQQGTNSSSSSFHTSPHTGRPAYPGFMVMKTSGERNEAESPAVIALNSYWQMKELLQLRLHIIIRQYELLSAITAAPLETIDECWCSLVAVGA